MAHLAPASATWHDPASPLHIEYSPRAMEQIRTKALEAFRASLETGGLLLGERAGAEIRILDTLDLLCSHQLGPRFLLTSAEKAKGRELIESTTGAQVVGWYVSKVTGEIALQPDDLALFRDLFPAQWQISLVIKPSAQQPARAAFFFADQSGEIVKGAENNLETAEIPPALLTPAPPEVPARETPSRLHPLNWILLTLGALALGAAIFEVQNLWFSEPPPAPATTRQSAPPPHSTEIPGEAPGEKPPIR